MIIGSDKLIEWVKANSAPYWRIMGGEKGPVIIQSDMKEGLTVDDSIPRLDQALKMIGTGTYTVDNWQTGQNQNSRYKTRFVMNQNDNISAIGAIQNQSIPDVQSEITKALNDYKRELELERLKSENTELKSEVDGVTFRILKRIEPYMGGIIEGVFPDIKPAKAIAGTNTNNNSNTDTVQATQEEQNRLDNALENWSEQDSDLITLVEEIAKLAKTDPAKYKMAKSLLMGK